MEINETNFQTLAQYLQQTLSPDISVRRPAENFLQSIEVNNNYAQLLLHLIDKDNVDMTIRVAGAITFKNYVKRNWGAHLEDDGVENRIHEDNRLAIKQLILTLMLKSPSSIQKQLSDAVSIIGKYDFPKEWPQLINEMVEKMSSGDFYVINGVLQTAHSLFKKYRYEFKSQKLWEEIKMVLDTMAKPLTDLLVATMHLVDVHANNDQALKVIYSSLLIISKVFYSLNSQDLPEFFEDNMQTWMTIFLKLLTTNVPSLQSDEDEETVIEQLKSQICDNIGLYAQKYDEEFQPFMPEFINVVLGLLYNTNSMTKYDALVSKGLQFITIMVERNRYKEMFESPELLKVIFEKVVIPNIGLRNSDEELFEDNPEEYIRRDIEGSDVDTRRRSVCDLVKNLSAKYEEKVFAIFAEYINLLLNKYKSSPGENWRVKDTLIYLVTSMAVRGATEKHGVTQSSQLVPIPVFYKDEIFPELQRPNVDELPILKADAIKFLMTFRTILGPDFIIPSIPVLIKHLTSKSIVIHTYAACAIDKILIMRGGDGKLVVKKELLSPASSDLFGNLFGILSIPGSHENEYVMKCIMRSFFTLQEASMPYMSFTLPKLTEILQQISKNPSKPHFNHYLFETLSVGIKIVCKIEVKSVESFEGILFPVFQEILQQDVLEFVPYVFQILSMLLEIRTDIGQIPQPYWELFPCLLAPELWERSGNVTPLIRLITAFIKLGSDKISSLQKLNPILGIFQKMIASRNNDHEGFYLLQNLILHYPRQELLTVIKQVFVVLFQRLTCSKTTKYIRGLIIFLCFYAAKIGANSLIELIDTIQANMFGMVIDRLFIPNMGKVSENLDKKIVAVGMTQILCDAPLMFGPNYITFWPSLLQGLIHVFELPTDESTIDGDHFIEIEDVPGYQAAYSQLNFAQPKPNDPLGEIQEPRLFLAQKLAALTQQRPGEIVGMIARLPDAHKETIQKYCAQSGIQLV